MSLLGAANTNTRTNNNINTNVYTDLSAGSSCAQGTVYIKNTA